jgi:GTP-binding protein
VNKGRLVVSALSEAEMPHNGWTEVAFLGRSNAGKSSLINQLVGARVALVSSQPGRTQRIHFYAMNGWYLVDLPGFGYAKASKTARQAFGAAVERYLFERQPLVAGVLIQDVRRDPEEDEMMVVNWAAERNVLLVIVASKVDKLNRSERQARAERLRAQYPAPVLLVSNRTGEGIDDVRGALRGLGLTV